MVSEPWVTQAEGLALGVGLGYIYLRQWTHVNHGLLEPALMLIALSSEW